MRASQVVDRAKEALKTGLHSRGWELRRVPEPSGNQSGFFVMPESCQIPGLDTLYQVFFGQREHGFFVEIGAFDGYAASNTFGVAQRGWSGILVEPVPQYAQECETLYRGRGDISVINLAVGATEGEVRLNVAGMLTTARPDLASDHAKSESGRRTFHRAYEIDVRQTTLDGLLIDKGVMSGFDLLVVDVEGSEPEVFAGFDLERWQPKMLIVELSETHPSLPSIRRQSAELYSRILDHGYLVVYKDAVNTVFVERGVWREALTK